jgi:hypothetical protein
MGHALTNTKACETADAMALEKSKLGSGAKIVEMRRTRWDSNDLAYVVESPGGVKKDVVVTQEALKRRMST